MLKRMFNGTSNYFSKHFMQLMLFLVLLFVFRPFDRGGVYLGLWQLWLSGVFIAAVFNSNHSERVKSVVLWLAVPALVLNWVSLFIPNKWVLVAYLFFTFIFIAICATSIITRVILNARVTLETLRGVICVYFMIAFAFAFFYVMLNHLAPDSFFLSKGDMREFTHHQFLSEMMYYSFVTQLTIGYGDITAIRDVAQTASILEGIIGQFYIAMLVARLVAVYSFMSKQGKKLPEE